MPEELAQGFDEALQEFEEKQKMPYVTHIERRGIERGRQEGKEEGLRISIMDTLETRFHAVPDTFADRLEQIKDIEALRTLHKRQ